ncbi:MAG: hypothetical protein CM1200mP38_4500 [Dehalococcoidia bacterium]|nr:MAG: hypothetical protein CM1200mP38_4500 [Dehalococcoidia bacterium]
MGKPNLLVPIGNVIAGSPLKVQGAWNRLSPVEFKTLGRVMMWREIITSISLKMFFKGAFELCLDFPSS